jgi:GH15 family glucan-1,4-alpha-glucosidase
MKWIRDSVYKPISAYGVIGDTRTAALVGVDGSIDWCCFPRFDSPSVFGAILDVERGGRFRIQPVGGYTSTQRYFPLTNILVTTFPPARRVRRGRGAGLHARAEGTRPSPAHEIHRRIRGLRGNVDPRGGV